MAVKMRDLLGSAIESLRYEPTAKHLRVCLGDELVADTANGRLVWEPQRIVPTYAVPVADVSARLQPTESEPAHSCAGSTFDVVVNKARAAAAAFRPDDPDLADYVVLDFGAFAWREEDESIVAHPHDPFKRIDILASTRHVRIESQGRLLADSSRPVLLFETLLPVRFYLPPADIVVDLEPTDTVTHCAYKGRASYYSVPDGPSDVAWTYHEPLREAEPVRERIAFFDEHVDVVVDGRRQQRPVTPWSD
jgi:uncharacterized protein (DUF427 family)